jgi:uncharacterized hydrophobic protein (TIGR00271 family)
MVIAPLGGAILAVAGALVTGRLDWQPRTLAQVLISAAGVVAIGYGVSLLLPDPFVLTPSIDARTDPGLLDLGVALAAGAAGAYVASHRTGSDALPGVAIAVSLVPPLATVGICLELGRIDDAGGALLLFTTNFAAIVVAASVVFVLAGGRPPLATEAERRRFRLGIIVGAIALVAISLPLAWHGVQTAISEISATRAAPVVAAWVGERDLVVTAYKVDGERIDLAMTGPSAPTDLSVLADELAATLGHPVELSVTFAPRTVIRAAQN